MARKQGKWTYYSIAPTCCEYAEGVIRGLLESTGEK
jgi:hypothetical protein